MQREITAVIPIRKGSERVKDKNIRNFGDTNLLQLKIDELKKCKYFSNIVVNTDSDIAIKIAIDNDIHYHKREEFYASSACPANDYFEYLANSTVSQYIAYTPVTAPFISAGTFDKCVEMFDFENPNDTIITGSLLKDFLFKGNEPLNFKLDKHPRSQDFNDIFSTNFGLCLLSRAKLLETRTILGSNPRIFKLAEHESIDIDTPLDFEFAEFIYSKLKGYQ